MPPALVLTCKRTGRGLAEISFESFRPQSEWAKDATGQLIVDDPYCGCSEITRCTHDRAGMKLVNHLNLRSSQCPNAYLQAIKYKNLNAEI